MRTSNNHEIDTFSLGEDGRKDANVGMDSQNNVGFVLCVGWKTLGTGEFYCVLASHPSRVRGLKRPPPNKKDRLVRSHPSRVRGLKHACVIYTDSAPKSHPSRVRGLKRILSSFLAVKSSSHPSWVRGLKLTDKNDTLTRNKNLVNVSFFSFGLSKKLYNKYIESF